MRYTVTFEQRTDNADYGKVVFVATREVADDATVNVYIDLISPDGVSVNTKNFATPDLVVTTPGTKKWSIPTDSNGDLLRGTYTIRVYVEQTITTPGTQTLDESQTYYYNAHENLADLTWQEVCVPGVVASLTLIDSATYAGFTVLDRVLKIVFPPQEGLADLTTDGTSLQIQPHWSGVDYVGSVVTECYKQSDDSADLEWFEYYNFAQQLTKTFSCSSCDISECMGDFATTMAAKTSLSQADRDKMALVSTYEMAYRTAINCGNMADAATWAGKIKTTIGCDCGCDETATTPAPITSIIPELVESNASVWTVIEDADLANSWDTDTYPDQQLRWRRISNSHIELMGRLGKTGLSSGTGSAFLSNYFTSHGITLLDYYDEPAMLVGNGGSPSVRFGGSFSVSYTGTIDVWTLTVSNDVTPSGTAVFAIHALIPIA